jgi:hypothetical protein
VPYPDYQKVRPARIRVAGPVAPTLRWGLRSHYPDFTPLDAQGTSEVRALHHLDSLPGEQSVTVDCFWSDLILNGERTAISYPGALGNHGLTLFDLHKGWNALSGRFEVLQEDWDYLLGFPPDSGVSLHAIPDSGCAEAFAVSPLLPAEVPVETAPMTRERLPAHWRLEHCSLERITPARLIAWETPMPDSSVRDLPFAGIREADCFNAHSALWCLDFQDEYYGHPVIEVDAPQGSILDIAYDDWARADGCVNLYGSNPFVDAADRFILRGGRQRIEVLNPRGGIFLQIILRAPQGAAPASLRLLGCLGAPDGQPSTNVRAASNRETPSSTGAGTSPPTPS